MKPHEQNSVNIECIAQKNTFTLILHFFSRVKLEYWDQSVCVLGMMRNNAFLYKFIIVGK